MWLFVRTDTVRRRFPLRQLLLALLEEEDAMDSVNNNSTLYDTSIGQLFKQNAAPLLQRRLNFVPAKQPDLHIDILKSKYKPLNSQQMQVQKTSGTDRSDAIRL